MATDRKLEITISEKGGDKLKDSLKDIKIEAISAKKAIKEIADEAPNAASKIESTLDGLSKNTDNLKENAKYAMKVNKAYFATTDELFKSFKGYNKDTFERVAQLSKESGKLTITMQQIQGLNEKVYKSLGETSTARLAANQAEIDGLTKAAKSVTQVIEIYEKRKILLKEDAEINKARISNEYEDAKKAGGDIVALEKLKADQIAIVDAKLKEDLKQNAKGYETSAKAFNEKLYKSFTADWDVAASTVSRKTKNAITNAQADAEKTLGITSGTLKQVAQDAIDAEDKNKKAAAEAKKAGDTAAKATETAKATGDAAAKAAEATKIVIDIDATRKNVEKGIAALKHYQSSLEQNGKAAIEQYNKDIAAAGDNVVERKKLEAARLEAVNFYGRELIKVSQAITAAEKKEQDLGLVQLQQYGEKIKGMGEGIKGTLTKTSEYFGTAFTAISDVYKAEIAGIDEEILHLKNKNAEFTQDYTNQTAEVAAISAQIALKQKEDANADVSVLEGKKNAEQKILDEMLAKKQEIEAKERELQAKKAKEQQKQEKIEKLNRKATLLKNIGEGIFNVAQGVTKALSYGPILGPILAAVVAAAGAIQVGIMTNQLRKFADGGLLNGKRHSQGGMRIEGSNIEVEGGEYVINRESTSKNLGLVRYINSQRKELTPNDMCAFFTKAARGYEPPFQREFASGGQMPAIEAPNHTDNDALVKAIQSIKIESKVAVTDIIRAQENAVQIDGWSGN